MSRSSRSRSQSSPSSQDRMAKIPRYSLKPNVENEFDRLVQYASIRAMDKLEGEAMAKLLRPYVPPLRDIQFYTMGTTAKIYHVRMRDQIRILKLSVLYDHRDGKEFVKEAKYLGFSASMSVAPKLYHALVLKRGDIRLGVLIMERGIQVADYFHLNPPIKIQHRQAIMPLQKSLFPTVKQVFRTMAKIGILCTDLKPDNSVIITKGSKAYLRIIDFGSGFCISKGIPPKHQVYLYHCMLILYLINFHLNTKLVPLGIDEQDRIIEIASHQVVRTVFETGLYPTTFYELPTSLKRVLHAFAINVHDRFEFYARNVIYATNDNGPTKFNLPTVLDYLFTETSAQLFFE